ncbi:MAG: hypothetical protein QOC92_1060 [Acidimicrobiaceae bacterium]|jgi:hypothetical protein
MNLSIVDLDGFRRKVRADTQWREWAAARDFTYQDEAPELLGVWFPVFDGMERYVHVIGGQWLGLGFWAFSRGTWNKKILKQGGHTWLVNAHMFLQLPGALPPEILDMQPNKAFELLGGKMSTAFDFSYRGADWLEGRRSHMSPELLEGALQNLALQINAAPAELWAARPTSR